jgi:hypothetical protein
MPMPHQRERQHDDEAGRDNCGLMSADGEAGERNPIRLQQRAIEVLSGTPPDAASA